MQDQQLNNRNVEENSNSSINSKDTKKNIKNTNYGDQQADEVKILTYNVFMRPPLIKNNEDDFKNERCELIIKNEIEKFDILCFQELFRLFSYRRYKMAYSTVKQGFLHHVSSPQPKLFGDYLVDGGLTILSRYPIVESCFKPFVYSILADSFQEKGVLYAKIKVNDKHIHMLNTHTQATYKTNEKEIKWTVVVRLEQIVESRRILEECLKQYGFERGDICIFAGDFNVDSNHPVHPIDFLDNQDKLKSILGIGDDQESFDEYRLLVDTLSGKGKDVIIDIGRIANDGKPPITFADVYKDQNGQIQPLETALTHKSDLKSQQSLDYIFQIIPNGLMVDDQPDNLNNKGNKIYNQINQSSKGGYTTQSSSNNLVKNAQKNLNDKNFVVDFSKSKVEKFFVKGQNFTQLSDHYGVSATISHK
ncbi:hypothetical protein ABPG72_022530 [Tetrahymena utriculariae]